MYSALFVGVVTAVVLCVTLHSAIVSTIRQTPSPHTRYLYNWPPAIILTMSVLDISTWLCLLFLISHLLRTSAARWVGGWVGEDLPLSQLIVTYFSLALTVINK